MDLQTLAAALALAEKRGISQGDIDNQINDALAEIIAEEYSSTRPYALGSFCLREGKLYRCNTTIATGEAWNANHWDAQPVSYYLERMEQPITKKKPRFGVSGVGGSAPALTRLWDAVGMTATPSTDTVAGSSDFDDYAPFNRRKCVGTWSAGDGKAVFTVEAYEGDADYAEDGSMGDYVAVDVTPFYYIEDGDIIGVSEQQFRVGRSIPYASISTATSERIPIFPFTLSAKRTERLYHFPASRIRMEPMPHFGLRRRPTMTQTRPLMLSWSHRPLIITNGCS